ncbi:hypothetical protein VTP01DRAFT_3817 [Rhizomucor pusillus]|uniref:uncharacterized protein n=1 Tax=Rhizomucor pusillus TaxID=4840 RepID=UPI003743D1D8
MFPSGYFYIISRKHGFALDVYDGQTKTGANIIVWPQKFQDSDNQLWTYDNGRIVNKKSGHVLDVSSSAFKKDKTIVQNKKKDNHPAQEWGFENGFIYNKVYPTMVLDIKGDSDSGGAQVLLYNRKDSDNLNQLWYLEPYDQFAASLNLAADTGPLHKQPNFGQPRLGYGAEVGVPPELTKLPDNIKVVGVGDNVAPTPSTPVNPPAHDNSELPEALAAAGYQGSATHSAPGAQPGYPPQMPPQHQQHHAAGAYPPPPAPSSNYPHSPPTGHYPPPPSSEGYGSHPQHQAASPYSPPPGSAYPASPQGHIAMPQPGAPPSYPPPHHPQQPYGGGYPSPQPNPAFPQPGFPSPQQGAGAYPPPSQMPMPGAHQQSQYPPPPSNYPPYPQ